MLSYLNDPTVKTKYVERFAQHRAHDQVIQGLGFENGLGCFVGCTLDAYDHSRFPIELGWPIELAYLADAIFEGIPKVEAAQFGTDLLAAVPTGVNLSRVVSRVQIAMHRRALIRLAGNKEPYAEQCRKAIQNVIDFLGNDEAWSAESAEYQNQRDDLLSICRETR